MTEYLSVLLLALLPAFGNFAGGLLADVFPASGRTLSLALHGAAGIVLAVVGVALMPEVLKADPPWIIVVAFVAGGIFFILADQAMSIVQGRMGDEESESNPWAIFFGVATDLFSDGVMIGAGSAVALSLGLLLALGQVSADIPEGFATITTFKRHGASRRKRLLLSLLFAVPVLLGATIGYGVLRDEPIIAKLALLAFTAGILITVTVEEIVPQAHKAGEARLATLVFVGGFALFTLLSIYVK
jgi:ZIP family zinc transporter